MKGGLFYMGRKPLVPGVKRSKLPPSDRGFCSISLGEEATKKLQAYMKAHGIRYKATAVARLLDDSGAVSSNSAAPVPVVSPVPAPSIPWDLIEEKLVESLGQKHAIDARKAVATAKAALE